MYRKLKMTSNKTISDKYQLTQDVHTQSIMIHDYEKSINITIFCDNRKYSPKNHYKFRILIINYNKN